MQPVLKVDINNLIKSRKPVKLDLGCGWKKRDGHIGIDKLEMDCVDIVADVNDGLQFMPDNSVDEIYSKSVFEHVENFELLMSECVRVLKKGGKCYIFVPHWSSPYFYQDYTHIRFFGLYTFYMFVEEKYQLDRKQPIFYTDIRIRIITLKLVFKSTFKLLQPFRKLFTYFVNSSKFLQAFYEENWSHSIPCYGIEVVFTPDK